MATASAICSILHWNQSKSKLIKIFRTEGRKNSAFSSSDTLTQQTRDPCLLENP